jgi:hypothetical protein
MLLRAITLICDVRRCIRLTKHRSVFSLVAAEDFNSESKTSWRWWWVRHVVAVFAQKRMPSCVSRWDVASELL